MSTQLELLRARVDFHQRRCTAGWDVTGLAPDCIYLRACAFHTECRLLREAEAELAKAEKKRAPQKEREHATP